MKGIDKLFIATVCTLFLCSCSQDRRQAKGFVLPKGDIEKGKSEFVNLGCHQCHTVANVKLPNPPKTSEVTFALGGEVSRVKTYGELVTSIIQPQHVLEPKYLRTIETEKRADAESPMPTQNEQMNVSQLIDIVAFLNASYVKAKPTYDDYHYYGL